MPDKLKSRKFWVTALGALALSIGTQLGFTEETMQNIIYLLSAYILGQGVVDASEKFNKQ